MQDKTYAMSIRPFHLWALAASLLFCSGCVKNLPATAVQSNTSARAATAATSSPVTFNFDLPARVGTPFYWGVNGHPMAQTQYFGNLPLQMSLIKELQATWYRVDFNPGTAGDYSFYTMNDFFAAASANGINILPVVIFPSSAYSLPASQAEAAGQINGQFFAHTYGANFQHVYQVGNEEDGKIGFSSITPIIGYNPNIWAVVSNYMKGMCEGIKAADPGARIIINSAGHPSFNILLFQSQIPFDIIGYDNYDGESSLVTDLGGMKDYGMDIWLTEINNYQTATEIGDADQAQPHAIDDELEAIDEMPVKAVFFYELFNEDGATPAKEATLGLTNWATEYTTINRNPIRPVFEEFKFKIEETTSGWNDFIYALYLHADFRQPDGSGLQYWTNWAANNRNIAQIVDNFLPQENYAHWVDQQYQLLLGRAADPSGESYWTQQLVNGATRESVIEQFIAGAEFMQAAGGTSTLFVDRVCQTLLGHGPEGTEADWIDDLDKGTITPTQIAQQILSGIEYETEYVTNIYNTVLNRAPDQGGLDSWVRQMQSGMNQLDVFKSFLNGPEFYQQAIHQGYERNHPGYTF